jgi:hypothetical protein
MVGRLKIWELLAESGREGDNCMRIGSGIRPQRTNELNPNKDLLPTTYLFSKSIMASTIIASRRDDRTENHIGLTDNYKRRYHVI